MKAVSYAGIGARTTGSEMLRLMSRVASRLGELGLVLRTGGAPGADQAFISGVADGFVEIFLPWPSYEGLGGKARLSRPLAEAFEIASRHHPAWGGLKESVRALMARNVHVLLGASLEEPVAFVLYWTEDESRGGTAHALRVARAYGIPTIHLGKPGALEGIARLLTELGVKRA